MDRRGFIGSILAAGTAPWIAKAGVLMPVKKVITSEYFDGPLILASNGVWIMQGSITIHGTTKEWMRMIRIG